MTRTALFAPWLTPSSGGVWQYLKILIQELTGVASYDLWMGSAGTQAIELDDSVGILQPIDLDDRVMSIRRSSAYKFLKATDSVIRITRDLGQVRCGGLRRRFCDRYLDARIDDAFRRRKVELIHVPVQHLPYPQVVSRYPYLMNPHDFQHEHFPQFFNADQLAMRRERWYAQQRSAAALVVHSRQTMRDALLYLKVPEDRVHLAPYGVWKTLPEPSEDEAELILESFDLPSQFIFYPAKAWPHKNHRLLIQALSWLARRDIQVSCVLTDMEGACGEATLALASDLGVRDRLHVLGRVSDTVMGALYRKARQIVVPSLFEQNSGPMLEALNFGKAVAVSRLEDLELSLGGAGQIFDPQSVEELSRAIEKVWCSDAERVEHERRARERRGQLSWEPFRKVYREAFQAALNRGRLPG